MWRPCNVTPTQSLTGPVGQPFTSRLWIQQYVSPGCTNSQWNRVSPVNAFLLHWWPQRDWSLSSPWAPCWQWEASQGFALMMWKASCDHTLASLVPFHSLLVLLLLLATQWLIRAPIKLLVGSPVEALQFHSNNTVSLVQRVNRLLTILS